MKMDRGQFMNWKESMKIYEDLRKLDLKEIYIVGSKARDLFAGTNKANDIDIIYEDRKSLKKVAKLLGRSGWDIRFTDPYEVVSIELRFPDHEVVQLWKASLDDYWHGATLRINQLAYDIKKRRFIVGDKVPNDIGTNRTVQINHCYERNSDDFLKKYRAKGIVIDR